MLLIILHVSREWQQCGASAAEWVRGKPTENQIQKSDFLYAAGICAHM